MSSPGRGPALGVALVILSTAPALAGELPEPPGPSLHAEVSLRAYGVYPKLRFRDGARGVSGDSFRTQRLGLDEWRAAPGAVVGAGLTGLGWVGLHAWTSGGRGEETLDRDASYGGRTLPRGSRVRTQYALTYLAAECLHRFDLLDGSAFVDAGVRLEYLDLRVNVVGAGRTALEAAWPSLRLHAGVRPLSWLELEGQLGGFELGFPFASTKVTGTLEAGALARFRLPGGAFAEVGGLLFHAHLEEDPGRTREDVLHLRHRAVFGGLGLAF